jgi:hypothetical protein
MVTFSCNELSSKSVPLYKETYAHQFYGLGLWCLTPTFNNISDISWRSALLVEERGVPRENHHLPQITDKL